MYAGKEVRIVGVADKYGKSFVGQVAQVDSYGLSPLPYGGCSGGLYLKGTNEFIYFSCVYVETTKLLEPNNIPNNIILGTTD